MVNTPSDLYDGDEKVEDQVSSVLQAVGPVLQEMAPSVNFVSMLSGESGTVEELIGELQSLLEQAGVDADDFIDRLVQLGLTESVAELDKPVVGEVNPIMVSAEINEKTFRALMVAACRGVLSDQDCDELITCGFCELEDGEPFAHQMYRTVVNMVGNVAVVKGKKKPKRADKIQAAIELLAGKGVENPGVVF